jgi:predicted amidohydrolase YtcJ
MRELNSYGITSVIEPGIDERSIAVYRSVRDAGRMTVRTDILYRAMRLDEVRKGICSPPGRARRRLAALCGHQVPARRWRRGWAYERTLPPCAW